MYYRDYSVDKYEKGGKTNEKEGVDLFIDNDGNDIPPKVQEILDKYEERLIDGMDYKEIAQLHDELYEIGYTFESGLDGQAYDLRKIGQKGKISGYANGGMMAKGGSTGKKGGKFGINDMVMVDDSGYIKLFTGFDTTKPAKIIDVNKVKTSRGTFYTYGLEFNGGKKPFNYAMENKLSLADGGMMAKGGMVVTSIKDIPNFKEELEAGNVTYRGLGLGKIYKDFYNLAGTNGFQIKVKKKSYYITDKEFDSVSRDKVTGKRIIQFDAPYRKG